MTIQHMVDNWKKQNINFLEILYTPYVIINPKFCLEWEDFAGEWREALAHYDVKKAILSMGNQALHAYKQDPTDFKKQMNTYRIFLSLFNLIVGKDYWNCIHFEGSQQHIFQIIRHQGCSLRLMEDALEWLHRWVDDAEGIAERFYKKFGSYNKTAIDEACNDFILSLIKKQLIWSGDV